MKITTIETYQLRCPLGEPFGWSQGWIDHRATGIVKITTDAGIVGWGEGCTGPAAAVIGEIFAPLLLGADPRNRNRLWQQLFASLYNANLVVGFGGSALSAIDTALWDIAGKVAEQPISALLGGRIRDKVAVYATGLYYTKNEFPTKLLDEARGYVDAGFKGMKTKVGGLSVAEDFRRVAALRDAIGDEIHLMVDANEGYNAITATHIGRQLADLDILWFEEPVNAQDLAGYQQVKAMLP
ncbi:MAG: mandelate racemase/muconate lactonizing enzyme family protein, partial [Caldilineaceae bacterium]